jgi:hypothetical protein
MRNIIHGTYYVILTISSPLLGILSNLSRRISQKLENSVMWRHYRLCERKKKHIKHETGLYIIQISGCDAECG